MVRVEPVDEADGVFPWHVAVGVRFGAGFMDGREFIVEHAFHVGSHDVPLVEVWLFAVLAEHENAVDAARGEVLGKLLDQFEVAVECEAFFGGDGIYQFIVLIILNERRWIVRIVSKGIFGHIGEKVHTTKPR